MIALCRISNAQLQLKRNKKFHVTSQMSLKVSRLQLQHSNCLQPRQFRRVQTSATAPNIVEVDAEGLEREIMERDRPLVIDFYANWCGPCVLLAKELEKVAEQMGDKVRILKVDTDQNPEISSQLQIQGLPTLIFVGMSKGRPALRTEGLLPANVIQEIVENDLEAPAPQQ